MLQEDDINKQIINPSDIPEPELPEAFCKRFGAEMNYKYLRYDIGPRVDRFCWKRNAYI
jgi:hypothetical protein